MSGIQQTRRPDIIANMPPKRSGRAVVITRATREERRRERAGIELVRRSDRVEMRYDKALRIFFWYMNAAGVSMPSSPFVLDDIVVEYIKFPWHDGESLGFEAGLHSNASSAHCCRSIGRPWGT